MEKRNGEEKMRKAVFTLAAAVLVAAGFAVPGRAATAPAPQTLVKLDFSKAADQGMVQLDGTGSAAFTGSGRLELTDGGGSETGVAFIKTPFQVSDYLASFDFEVKSNDGDTNPADAMLFIAQTAGLGVYGGGGGAGGYARSDIGALPDPTTPQGGGFPGYSYAIEFNMWGDQGLPDDAGGRYTVALDVNGQRSKIGITPFNFINQGVLHADVRVVPSQLTMSVSKQGSTTPLFTYTSPSWLVNFFQAPKPLFLGFTASTGGAYNTSDILNFQLQTGLPPPSTGGTGGSTPAPAAGG
jgi:hypothetical protein